ncbi:MAG: hypothetical protein FJX52_17220, partial [Alphaproteobacteria bacterium]|nr:hypothetical protein [Alphaproteobacteria bacterium]
MPMLAHAAAMTRRDRSGTAMPPDSGPVTGPFVRVGRIVGARGVRGEVRVVSDTAEAADIAAYGPLYAADGSRRFDLTIVGAAAGALVGRVAGITDRNAAEALKGTALFVPRGALPV